MIEGAQQYRWGNTPDLVPVEWTDAGVDYAAAVEAAGWSADDDEVDIGRLRDTWNGHPRGSVVLSGLRVEGHPFVVLPPGVGNTTAKPTVVEQDTRSGQYDMPQTFALIDHPMRERLLLVQGFGGMDSPSGGAYRWRHGLVARVRPDDTLAGLRAEPWAEGVSTLDALLHGESGTGRELLDWPGYAVETFATACGL